MKVKKYVVDSLPQAMGQIKVDLGNDAMILHTKKIKIGGFFGLFGKEKIEVIAAADSNSKLEMQKPKIQSPYNYDKASLQANTHIVRDNEDNIANQASNTSFKNTDNYNKEKELIINSAEQTVNTTTSLTSDVNEIKRLMVKMMMNQPTENDRVSNNKHLKQIYDNLIKQGTSEEIALSIIEKVVQRVDENVEPATLFQEVRTEVKNRLGINGLEKQINEDTKIVHVVGPTGVGKTTTIAKLAAEKVLKHKKRVAFITADTYRIGAVEQLRTYAEILHAPIEIVFSTQDTLKAIEKLKSYDLIFMDTAGRNYHNEMYISELNNILAKNIKSETYLVLSLTHKYEDMISILEQFKKVNIDKILFTKFDETLTYGSILNILSRYPYATSYITNGQNVPDDIEIFEDEKVATSIVGG